MRKILFLIILCLLFYLNVSGQGYNSSERGTRIDSTVQGYFDSLKVIGTKLTIGTATDTVDILGDLFAPDIYLANTLRHAGDDNTYLYFLSDQIDLVVGGLNMLRLDESSSDIIHFNVDGVDVDFRIDSDTKTAFDIDGATGIISYDSVKIFRQARWIADDGQIVLPTGYTGSGTISVGDRVAWGMITFTSSGDTIDIEMSKGNVANTDLDGYLSIYKVSAGVIAVKNRTGIYARVKVNIDLYKP